MKSSASLGTMALIATVALWGSNHVVARAAREAGFALTATSYIGLVPTMLGNLFYLFGVSRLGAATAAAFLYLSPVFSAALSILWLGSRHRRVRRDPGRTDDHQQVRASAAAFGARLICSRILASTHSSPSLTYLPSTAARAAR